MLRPASLALLVGLAGCDDLFNLAKIDRFQGDGGDGEDSNVDAFIAKDCSSVHFPTAPPLAVADLSPAVGGDPFLRSDQLELFFVRQGTNPFEIWRATRRTTTAAFVIDTAPAPFNIPGTGCFEPSMTADGSQLVFVADTSTGGRAYVTFRDADGVWSPPVPLPGLTSVALSAGQLSWDGLAYYFMGSDGHLYESRRASVTEAFGATVDIGAAGARYPSVSADGLELYTSYNSGIGRSVRMTTEGQFPPPSAELEFGGDPYLLPSSTQLVVSYDGSIAVVERTCP